MEKKYYIDEDRKFWKYLLFSLLLPGLLYSFWLFSVMVEDLNRACFYVEDDSDTDTESPSWFFVNALSLLTLDIYRLFWLYKQGNRIQKCAGRYRVNIKEGGSTYLLWYLIGDLVGIVAVIIAIATGAGSLLSAGSLASLANGIGGMLLGSFWIIIAVIVGLIGKYYGTYLLITNMNTLFHAYNRQVEEEYGPEKIYPYPHKIPAREPQPAPQAAPQPKAASGRTIRCDGGTYAGGEFSIRPGETFTLGRDESRCNLVFQDEAISRIHCTIRLDQNGEYYHVTDHSRNGTKLNGSVRLNREEERICYPGTALSLGNGLNRFVLL